MNERHKKCDFEDIISSNDHERLCLLSSYCMLRFCDFKRLLTWTRPHRQCADPGKGGGVKSLEPRGNQQVRKVSIEKKWPHHLGKGWTL